MLLYTWYEESTIETEHPVEQFSKNSNSKTQNGRDVLFTPKCDKYEVVFLVKKIRGIDDEIREI